MICLLSSSRAVDGSSSNRTWGLEAIALEIATRCDSPPDQLPAFLFCICCKSKSSINLETSFLDEFGLNSMFCFTVK